MTRNTISFDRTLHAVDDLGLDDTGGTLCDSDVENALATDGTLIEFPDGTYRFQDMRAINVDRAGLSNVNGHDPEFITDDISNVDDNIGWQLDGSDLLFENITLNYLNRSDDGGPMFYMTADTGNIYAGNITIKGYFYRRGFTVQIGDANGEGLMENLDIRDGQKNGRLGSGILVNQTGHAGTLTIRDSSIWHVCSGGIYASPNSNSGDTGPVIIENCHLKNNNTANVRVGGTGDEVRGCTFVQNQDTEGGHVTWTDPIPLHNSGFRVPRHMQFRNESVATPSIPVENCTFEMDPPSNISLDGGIRLRGDYEGDVTVRNSEMSHEWADDAAIYAEDGSPGSVILDDFTLVGKGAGSTTAGVYIADREDSEIKNNCCVELTDNGQDGFYFLNVASATATDSNINVPGTAIVEDNSTVSESNLSFSETCSFASTTATASAVPPVSRGGGILARDGAIGYE
jgi:hypothetical protein